MKLVRDGIPRIIEESGRTCEYYIADDEEYRARLYEKMHEELNEFIENPSYEEAADIWEVLRALCLEHALCMEVVENVAMDKRETTGGFYDKIILEKVNESR